MPQPLVDAARQASAAQGAPTGRDRPPFRCGLLALAATAMAGGPTWAQSGDVGMAGGQKVFTPYVSIEETLTDNYAATSAGKSAEAITRLTAGAVYRSRSGRIQGTADYGLSAVLNARNGNANSFQHRLTGDLNAEWFERQGFLQAKASIQQVSKSLFGAQTRADGLPDANSTEQRSLQLTPSWQGLLPGGLRIVAQASASWVDVKGSDIGDGQERGASARISQNRPGPLDWYVEAIREDVLSRTFRDTSSTRLSVGTSYVLTEWDLRLNASAGRERADYTTATPTDYTTWSLGASWTPSPRTRVSAQFGERAFGRTHDVQLEYRTPRTSWQYLNGRTAGLSSATSLGRTNLSFSQLFAAFATIEPDFARRSERVQAYLNQNLGTLQSGTTVSDRQEFVVTWRATPRTNVLASGGLVKTQRLSLDTLALAVNNQSTRLTQRNVSLSVNHRLTPIMALSVVALHTDIEGNLVADQSTQRSLSSQVSGQLSPQESWSLALRHTRLSGVAPASSETALVATYGKRF